MWRQAATQVFFALGLGFGSIIAYSSYNPKNNNCHRDAFTVSSINFLTSLLATLVVFAVLGFRAKKRVVTCVARWGQRSSMLLSFPHFLFFWIFFLLNVSSVDIFVFIFCFLSFSPPLFISLVYYFCSFFVFIFMFYLFLFIILHRFFV